jgi:site-specific DNA recombinase
MMTRPGRDTHASIPTALLYTRVSSEEQAREGVSLDAQLAECRRYAAQHGWMLGEEFQDILSGKRDDRPRYQALLAAVRRRRIEGHEVVVIVLRLDRLGRRILERVRCREELKALGVPVHTVREGGEVSDLVANILASVAEEESRALGERVAGAKRHIAANGWHIPGRAPWGYRLRPATPEERQQGSPTSVLEPDPATAPWVREAFARAAAGQTLHAVHRWIAGLPCPARGGRELRFQAVRKILASPVYVARLPHRDADVLAQPQGKWPALVDDTTWRRVREQVASHQRLPRQASQRYLLTGLLRCPTCGARMSGHVSTGHPPRYRCTSDLLGASGGGRACYFEVRRDVLETAVLGELLPLIEAATSTVPELRTALERAWEAIRQPASAGADLEARRLRQLEVEGERARKRLTTAAVLFTDGELDKTGYELLRDRARGDLEAIEAEAERLRSVKVVPALPPLETVLAEAGGWATAMSGGEVAAQREVVAALVDRVVPVRVGHGTYQVETTWTPLGDALRAVRAAASEVDVSPVAA